MRRVVAAIVLLLAGCPRGTPRTEPEPVAEPAPVEIDWPDAGVDGAP